jgi:predicted ribosomally synthesized peptide with SipW-like signal peptide
MKKIIGLGIVAIIIIAGVVGGTMAYFSDTETSAPTTFTAGTIDLAVNNQNPWTESFSQTFTDMKPSMTGNITETLKNVGTNPMAVWKMIGNVTTGNGNQSYQGYASSEPEYVAEGGTFSGGNPVGNNVADNTIDGVIRFSMTVGGNASFITEAQNYTVSAGTHQLAAVTSAIRDNWIYLGTIAPGGTLTVTESFHMDGNTTNWAQGDTMTFTITFFAQQVQGTPQPVAPSPQLTGYVAPYPIIYP